MARSAGKDGRLYASITSGGTAELIQFMETWSIDFTTAKYNVTSQGDTTQTYVSGLPDVQGAYNGFYDGATAQFYTAAVDGVARKFYMYPSATATGQYWFGTAIFDFSVSFPTTGPATVSGSFAGASVVSKVG